MNWILSLLGAIGDKRNIKIYQYGCHNKYLIEHRRMVNGSRQWEKPSKLFYKYNLRILCKGYVFWRKHLRFYWAILLVYCSYIQWAHHFGCPLIVSHRRMNASECPKTQKPYRHLFVFCKMNCFVCIKGLIWISKTNGIKTKRGTSAFFCFNRWPMLTIYKWGWDAFISLSLPGFGLLEIWMVVKWENWDENEMKMMEIVEMIEMMK